MTRDRLIAPDYPLNRSKASAFEGPEILTEDFETIRLFGSTEFDYKETDIGITILNNKIIRKPAAELAKQGLFEYTLIANAPRRTKIIGVISHEDSGLLISCDIDIKDPATYPSPRDKVIGLHTTWTAGEDNNPLYWFDTDQAQKLSEYRLSVIRAGS